MVEGIATVISRVAAVLRRNAVRDEFVVLLIEYPIGRIEGEELAYCIRLSPRLPNAGGLVYIKCILIGVVRRVVLQAVILVVAVLGLQQTRHTHMGYLARLGGGIKQVAEGFFAPAVGELRITVGKNAVHDAGVGRGVTRPLVEGFPVGSTILEAELAVLVDAVGSTDRQVILRINPVIKQVDCCPRRRNRRNRVVGDRRLGTKRQEEARRQRDGEGQNNHIWRDRAQPATTAIRHDGPPLARPMSTKKFPA